jgi:ribosomal protein S18 acetylase RimI-like enzyme
MFGPMDLEPVGGNRAGWIPLLLEADDSEVVVRSYLDEGELLTIRAAADVLGIVLLLREGDEVEVKNIAIVSERRGQRLGRRALAMIAERSRAAGASSLVVGTADSAPETIGFHERSGFRTYSVRAGFFDAYPEPIYVDGVLTHDMVMLRMELRQPS